MQYYVGDLGCHGLVAFSWSGQLTPRVTERFFNVVGPFATAQGAAYCAQSCDPSSTVSPDDWCERADLADFIPADAPYHFDELVFDDDSVPSEADPAFKETTVGGFTLRALSDLGCKIREATARQGVGNFYLNLVSREGSSIWCYATRAEFDAAVEVLGWAVEPAPPLTVEQAAQHLEQEQARSSVAEVRGSHLHIDPEAKPYDLAAQHVAGGAEA